jgi:hypothetical protein
MGSIDWNALTAELKTVQQIPAGARAESGGSGLARAALEQILGTQALRDAVDFYVHLDRGSELVRSVLSLIRPWSAMQRCHELFVTDSKLEHRRSAVELLRVICDRRALPWVTQYLDDPDSTIRAWGVGVLGQLLLSGLAIEDECSELIALAKAHRDSYVREKIAEVQAQLHSGAD